MDALWMLDSLNLSYFFIAPTLISGIWLIFKEKSTDGFLVALAALLWSLMNSVWLLGETLALPNYFIVCKICFVMAIGSLITGLLLSKDVAKTMSAFKRFRVKEVLSFKQDKKLL